MESLLYVFQLSTALIDLAMVVANTGFPPSMLALIWLSKNKYMPSYYMYMEKGDRPGIFQWGF